MQYLASFSSVERVLFNLMHKVGGIFDAVWAVIHHHKNYDAMTTTIKDREIWWYKTGTYYGMIFKLAFYSDIEPVAIDPAEDFTWSSGFKF